MKTMKRSKIQHLIVYIILRQYMKIQNAVSIYKDGDLIISYNMFSFLFIWQERGRVIVVNALKIRDGYSG